MRALARLVGLFLWHLALVFGWTAFAVVAALFLAEKTGLLTGLVRDSIARSLDAPPENVQLEHASLRWLDLELQLDGLGLGKQAELASIRSARARFALDSERGVHPLWVEADGAKLWLCPALDQALAGWRERLIKASTPAGNPGTLPRIHVRGLAVELGDSHVPLGSVEFVLESNARAEPYLRGRLVPAMASNTNTASEVYLDARAVDGRQVEFVALGSNLPLSTDYLPQGKLLETLQLYQPRGLLGLEAHASLDLGGGPSRGDVRVHIGAGNMLVSRGELEDLELVLEADFEAAQVGGASQLGAWRGRAALTGRRGEQRFQARARLGRASAITDSGGHAGRAAFEFHCPELALDASLFDLFGSSAALRARIATFAPRGASELWLSAELPEAGAEDGAPLARLRLGLEAEPRGKASMSYLGWPRAGGEARDPGFPLPLEAVEGTIVYARAPERLVPWDLALAGVHAATRNGEIRGEGLIHAHAVDVPPYLPGAGASEIDLQLSSPKLKVDEALFTALRGLREALPAEKTWEPLHPQGGALAIDLRLLRQVDMPYCAVDLELRPEELALHWDTLPVPLGAVHGAIAVLTDGHSEHGLSAHLSATLPTAKRCEIALRFQSDPGEAASPVSKPLDQLSCVEVGLDLISLVGSEEKVLVSTFPAANSAMEQVAPRGFADIEFSRGRDHAGAAIVSRAELTPREVQLTTQRFQMTTVGVRGRVLFALREPPAAPGASAPPAEVEAALEPIVGTWPGDVLVAFTARFPGDEVLVWGAGIDPADKNLLGALGQALASPTEKPAQDLSAFAAERPLDFQGRIRLPADASKQAELSARLFLRGNTLSTAESFRLEDLRGVLELRNGVVAGEHIAARLGHTPVALSNVRFAAGREGFRLDTGITAENVPLDREHLAAFVDKDTLEALLNELRLAGTLDIEDGRIAIRGTSKTDSHLEFSGTVSPSNMAVQLGLAWRIRSASAQIERLTLEGGRVRAQCRIKDLYGDIGGRDIGPASLLLTYVEPRLSIENITADFEGGKLLPLGVGAERGGTAFSLDLEEPFPFQLAIELRDVQLAGLTRGLFPSDFAAQGKLNAQLRLTGNTEDVLGIAGSGSLQVEQSRLWTIPVFRVLFGQLGLDNAATFESMATNVRVRNGQIEMRDIAVHSGILDLVGDEGTVDFDGTLHYDLDLRYTFIDRLGPLTHMLYSIQNRLLSIAIRGDMARPFVILKNPLSWLFGSTNRRRALPLPEFTPLPARF